MSEAIEIGLDALPIGGARALKAFVRPGAVLARILLESEGRIFSRRFDLGKNFFIDHGSSQDLVGSFEGVPGIEMQCQRLCQIIVSALNGPQSAAYRQRDGIMGTRETFPGAAGGQAAQKGGLNPVAGGNFSVPVLSP